RIDGRGEQGGEVPVAEWERAEERRRHSLLHLPPGLIIKRPKRSIPAIVTGQHNGSADNGSVLVSPQPVLREPARTGGPSEIQKIGLRIELVVAEKLKNGAVKLVGSRLHGDLDNGAAPLPIFRRVGTGLHFDFLA